MPLLRQLSQAVVVSIRKIPETSRMHRSFYSCSNTCISLTPPSSTHKRILALDTHEDESETRSHANDDNECAAEKKQRVHETVEEKVLVMDSQVFYVSTRVRVE